MLAMYLPLQQHYVLNLTILARARPGAGPLISDIRKLVSAMDPNLPILNAQPLEAQMTGPVEFQLRVAASVAGSVGIVGRLLAAIGIYGVTAYIVTRRTREIGVRIALGAQPADVVRVVLRQGLALMAVGGAIGLGLGAIASRLLTRLLFGLPPVDPITFAGTALLFAAIGLVACYVPVRRATRITAIEALRYE